MSLLFDVLKNKNRENAIPETEPPVEEDFTAVQSHPVETKDEEGEEQSLNLADTIVEALEDIATGLHARIEVSGDEDVPEDEPEATERTTFGDSLELLNDSADGDGDGENVAPDTDAEDTETIVLQSDVSSTADPAVAQASTPAAPVHEALRITSALAGDRRGVFAVGGLLIAAMLAVAVFVWLQPDESVFSPLPPATDTMATTANLSQSEYNVIKNNAGDVGPPIPDLRFGERPADVPRDVPMPSATKEPSSSAPARSSRVAASNRSQRSSRSNGVQVSSSRTEDPVYAQLTLAYQAFEAGDETTAEKHYRTARQLDPTSRDAILGLASIAMRNDRLEAAKNYYRQLLNLNPKDTSAITGLMSLRDADDPVARESRLKNLLRDEPDAAHLHFSLGTNYIRQGRWPEAQSAFFEAVRLNPENADYNFNLAISLDRLGQPAPAADYYRRAVVFSMGNQSFDLSVAEARLAQLSANAE